MSFLLLEYFYFGAEHELMMLRTWLRTTDDCYVTQYDLTDYAGECEDSSLFVL